MFLNMSFDLSRAAAACATAILAVSAPVPALAQSSSFAPSEILSGSSRGFEPSQFPQGSSTVLPRVEGSNTPTTDGSGARLVDTRHVEKNVYEIDVYSPSMDRTITNYYVKPTTDAPRPTVYLMQGSEGGEFGSTWYTQTNYEDFFADKPVNVVSAVGGRGSQFADWRRNDSGLGMNKWITYYSQELPYVMEHELGGNGRSAIAGLSMSGSAALNIATKSNGKFAAAVGFSPYPAPSSAVGRAFNTVMTARLGGDLVNAFGWPDDAAWTDNDPSAHPERLRGTKVWVTTGNGTPMTKDPYDFDDFQEMLAETVSRPMTDQFVAKARAAGVDITYARENYGSHSYEFFEHQLPKAWSQAIAPALGL